MATRPHASRIALARGAFADLLSMLSPHRPYVAATRDVLNLLIPNAAL
jgi:hypothetical protein